MEYEIELNDRREEPPRTDDLPCLIETEIGEHRESEQEIGGGDIFQRTVLVAAGDQEQERKDRYRENGEEYLCHPFANEAQIGNILGIAMFCRDAIGAQKEEEKNGTVTETGKEHIG